FRQLMAMEEMQQVYGAFKDWGAVCLSYVLRAQSKFNEAELVLHEAAERRLDPSLNGLAWSLATSVEAEGRDPADAVFYAEKAVTATARTNASYLATLAASYAASGQFTNAVRVQGEAIALLQDEDSKREYSSRLRLFEAGQRYRNDDDLAARA